MKHFINAVTSALGLWLCVASASDQAHILVVLLQSKADIRTQDQRLLAQGDVDAVATQFFDLGGVTAQRSVRLKKNRVVSIAEFRSSVQAGERIAAEETDSSAPSCIVESNVLVCYLQPSVFSGRSAQYTVDSPTETPAAGHHLYIASFGCKLMYSDKEPAYFPATVDISTSTVAGSGGHATSHSSAVHRPSLKLLWNGDNPAQIGNNLPSTSPPALSTTLSITAEDSAQAFAQWDAITPTQPPTQPVVRAYLPEVTGEVGITIENQVCDFDWSDPSIDGASILLGGSGIFRIAMDVPFERIEDFVSPNGLTTFTVQRSGNSHGNDAGYATPLNDSMIEDFVTRYSTCSTHSAEQQYPLKTEGLSIRDGGLYDISLKWSGSHRNHRAGEDMDIGFAALDQAERNCLYAAYTGLYTAPVPAESLILDEDGNAVPVNKTHVHLWTGESHFYPKDEYEYWVDGYCQLLATYGIDC